MFIAQAFKNRTLSVLLLFISLNSYSDEGIGFKAEIIKGACSFSTVSNIDFGDIYLGDFIENANLAARVKPLKILYECEGFAEGINPSIKINGITPDNDPETFFTSGTAEGVGFQIKNGDITPLEFNENKSKPLKDNSEIEIEPTEKLINMTVGFVLQNAAKKISSGSAIATITFDFIYP